MKTKFLKFIANPRYIAAIYIFAAALTAFLRYVRGPGSYNNYIIFKQVFFNTINEMALYAPYPDIYFSVNHYGIIFSFIIAPFAILPDWAGTILWNVANTLVFLYAIKELPLSAKNKAFFAWLCLQEFITAAFSFQFNIALTGMIILSATHVYKRSEVKSAFHIVLGTFIKLYGIVGLSCFFFVKKKIKFIAAFAIFCILFLLLPILISSYDFNLQSYVDWYTELLLKNDKNQILGGYQDISVMGFTRRILNDITIPNALFLGIGIPVFALPYFRVKQYQHKSFQILILASTLLFVVLFSSGSENPTYIIAVAGAMLWFVVQKKKTPLVIGLLVFVLLLTCFSTSDLVPPAPRQKYVHGYALKALPCTVVWLRIIYELLTKDFQKDYKL